MNIAAIRTFLAVTRTGNLNRAAQELNVTQSAVTSRLDALEARLGARLLNRARSGATLTKAGYAFLERAELIVTSWEAARAQASLPRGVTTMFSLVCDPALWSVQGQGWMETLRKAHPDTAMEVWAGFADEARRWLQSGMSDAALLGEPLTGPELAHRIFAEERLIQVASRPRAAMGWDPDYVFVDYGPGFRQRHAQTWPGDNTASLSFSNPDWALAHLLAHGGSAYLPEALVRPALSEGRLYIVADTPVFSRPVYLVWRKASESVHGWLGQAMS